MEFNKEEFAKLVKAYKKASAAEAEAKTKKEELKTSIVAMMGGTGKTSVKIGGVPLEVSYSEITSKRVSAAKVKAAFPDGEWEKFSDVSVSGRLTIK